METQQTLSVTAPKGWFAESVLVKLGLIGLLTLLLLIPSFWIQDLIKERQTRQTEVIKEISDKWSGSQLIEGPVLVLPYITVVSEKENTTGKVNRTASLTNIYILPEILNINADVEPEVLHRGIFDAVVYNTKIRVNGKFSALELIKSGINPAMVQWNKAKVVIGISDLKGLKNNPTIKIDNMAHPVEPDFGSLNLFKNNLVTLPDLSERKNTALNFNFDLDLRGSTELNFQHLGKSTNVTVEGNWSNPSFTGRYLPEKRSVSSKGFAASWKMAYFNRTLPQQWIAENTALFATEIVGEKTLKEKVSEKEQVENPNNDTTFGVKFILPVDQYQKAMRSAKYSVLIILLTFISLFFSELLIKRKVHLLQYILIGAAMTIYYTLLLSFSEQVGFNSAYLIASVATVLLIGLFIAALLNNKKPAIVFGGILTVFYGFIYIIIQLQDFALLFGSIGLFIIIAVMMYLSAKIDWNKKQIVESV
jgi:inner membrane protein